MRKFPYLKKGEDVWAWAKQLVTALNAAGRTPTLVNAANDAAAAAAGVEVGENYRNGSVVMIRVV